MVTLETNHGKIVIQLDFDKTPVTCKNVVDYVRAGHYDGTLFHRVIDGFMVQGGGMTPGMHNKETRQPIENEADKGGENRVGTVAMARTMDPHSATAQFFINIKDNDFLNFKSKDAQGWGYCVFGRVVEGMDVVDAIKVQKTHSAMGHQDVPVDDILIEKATADEDDIKAADAV